MSNLASFVWLVVSTFVFMAYIVVMFHVVVDLFRDPRLSGVAKAVWIIGLIFLPIVTSLIYIVARGKGMAERQRESVLRAKAETDAYVRDVAQNGPADQIAKAKSMLDDGTISNDEYLVLKRKALS